MAHRADEAIDVPILFHGLDGLVRDGLLAGSAFLARDFDVAGLAVGEPVALVKTLIGIQRITLSIRLERYLE